MTLASGKGRMKNGYEALGQITKTQTPIVSAKVTVGGHRLLTPCGKVNDFRATGQCPY